jgi:hypothetical protein
MPRRRPVTIRTLFSLTMLAAESQQVIWLRLLKLAAGGRRASAELRRMGPEKLAVGAQSFARVLCGESPERTVQRYRKKVRANRRRLSK